uniref:Uncharacterized protein n=1 Tax=Schizaphis graminum TaxID=13262 RepID=A0A2S2PRQ2_SCHGA
MVDASRARANDPATLVVCPQDRSQECAEATSGLYNSRYFAPNTPSRILPPPQILVYCVVVSSDVVFFIILLLFFLKSILYLRLFFGFIIMYLYFCFFVIS